jgi:hypothetical protein
MDTDPVPLFLTVKFETGAKAAIRKMDRRWQDLAESRIGHKLNKEIRHGSKVSSNSSGINRRALARSAVRTPTTSAALSGNREEKRMHHGHSTDVALLRSR